MMVRFFISNNAFCRKVVKIYTFEFSEIPFSPHFSSLIPFKSEQHQVMKQELIKHIEEAKAASHFVVNVSGILHF